MIISIEGNIGASKSTVLQGLESLGLPVCRERFEDWPLQEFINNPAAGALPLQHAVLRTMREDLEKHISKDVVIFERSPLASYQVFLRNLIDSGVVSSQEDLEEYRYAFIVQGWVPDVIIYLDKPPEVCHQHIQSRGQPGDSTMPLAYLQQLDFFYNEMMDFVSSDHFFPYDPRVFTVDANTSRDMVLQQVQAIIFAIHAEAHIWGRKTRFPEKNLVKDYVEYFVEHRHG